MHYLGGVALALFLSLLLLTKRNKAAADYLLGFWLLLATAHLLLFYFQRAGQYPQLLGAAMPLPLIHGPMLYGYTRALTNRRLGPRILALHFTPPAFILVWVFPFIMLPPAEKLVVFANHGAGYETFNLLLRLAIVASGLSYITLSLLALRRHRRVIKNEFSNLDKINLTWLQYLTCWIGAIWIGVLLRNDTVIFSTATLFIVFIGYFGMRQVGIFQSTEGQPTTSIDPVENPRRKKYQKSGLTAEVAERLHQELTSLMKNERVFRGCDLSLNDLAVRLNAPANYLSQVINEREGKNFYDYINTLRIAEFKRLASSPGSRKFTLLGLAQECGFNSKSSFNRYFRRATGMSPSQFIPEMQD